MQLVYGRLLGWSLKAKFVIITLSILAVILGVWTLKRQGFQLLPDLSLNEFTVRITPPPDTGVDTLERAVKKVEAILSETPGVESYLSQGGYEPESVSPSAQSAEKLNQAVIRVRIRSDGSTGADRDKVTDALRKRLVEVSGVSTEILLGENFITRALGGSDNAELMRITGGDPEVLAKKAQAVKNELSGSSTFQDVRSRGDVFSEQIRITVDRYKAAAQGVSVLDIAETTEAAIKGKVVGKLIRGDSETDIRLRLRAEDRATPDDLKRLPIAVKSAEERRSNASSEEDRGQAGYGDVTVLGQVARLGAGRGPREILRSDGRRVVAVTGAITEGSFSSGEEKARSMASKVSLPQGYAILPGAERFELMRSMRGLAMGLLAAILLTYAVMAVHYESVSRPFVILLTLPTAIVGPSIALSLTGTPISALVAIGAVVLVGVVVNNGILIVDYMDRLAAERRELRKGLIVACMVRLNPILMSTITTALAVLPICLGWGYAAELRRALGLTVASGLTASLFFTLLLLPALYELTVGRSRASASAQESASG